MIKRQLDLRAGQASLEFVMVVGLFLTAIFSGVQVCEIMKARSLVNVASYSAARNYAVTQNSEQAEAVARLYLGPLADLNLRLDVEGSNTFGGSFVATVSIDYPLLPILLIEKIFNAPNHMLVLSASTPMISE